MLNIFKSVFKNDAYENLDANVFMAKANADDAAVLLDVRTSEEHEGGNISGSINIDLFGSTFEKRVAMLDRQKSYFVYCRSGQRSGQACRIMHGLGFQKLYNMAGGILALPR